MIGIVVVSHSARLAEGVRELVAQLAQGRVPLATAGGIEGEPDVLGTDPLRVLQAIQSVYNEDGVVVLMDLGSALLSAEMAVELLPEEQRPHVRLCEAPLVEGAIAAAVQIAAGADLASVLAEARRALTAKAAHLAGPAPPHLPGTAGREILVTVNNRLGLHMRPAARLVQTAARFQARTAIRNLTRGSAAVETRSISQVMGLGLRQGHQAGLTASGADADQALAALAALFENGFGETESAPPIRSAAPAPPPSAGELMGTPISPGIAVGPLVRYRVTAPQVPQREPGEPESEWRRLQMALAATRREIEAARQSAASRAGEAEAAIFDAHLLFLEDPALLEAAHQAIFDRRLSAEAAWQATVGQAEAAMAGQEDAYQRERAADIAGVGRQVLQQMVGAATARFQLAAPGIVVAGELSPAEVGAFDPERVLGLCADLGSPLSHSAILARALGIPALMGVETQLTGLADGTLVALDGELGRVWVQPDDAQLAELRSRRETWLAGREAARASSRSPARTRDGRRMEVVANIGSLAEARLALANGAEGVGVLRTEFLFLDRPEAPSEEEQVVAYAAIAKVLGQRPLIIRTLDIGGDKPLPYLVLERESNPFLGLRGIRVSLARPDLLKTQLRAILRVGAGHQVKVMFPMVSSSAEVRAARALLAEAQAELRHAGVPCAESTETGIMVEVPAVIAMADRLAGEVQFFSIGTNDLSQYLMAADRTNARVARLADDLQPAVLRSVHRVVQAGHTAGIWVGLCGELAGDPLAVPLLVGMGLDELSANPAAIPAVKQAIARMTLAESQALLAALDLDSADAVRAYLQSKA